MAYGLGRWDIDGLAGRPGGKKFQEMVRKLERDAKRFESARKGITPSITAKKFAQMIRQTEEITEQISRIGGSASLAYAADTQSGRASALYARVSKLGAEVSNRTLFFDLWWKGLDGKNAARLARGSGELADYLAYKRKTARYALSEPEEKVINTLDVTGASALVKLYDRITNGYKYKMKGKMMTREEVSKYVKYPRASDRKAAYRAVLSKFGDNVGVLGEIYQNIVLNWRDEGVEMRGYDSPMSIKNMANDVDDGTVQSLLSVCREKTPVFGRFFEQKARMLGLKKLQRYDVYAPAARTKKLYTYDKSVRMVLGSLGGFSPLLGGLAKKVFAEGHVDSEPRHGKRDGAFCSSPAPRITPYVLLNHTGTARDLFTLAHEMGHAVHSMAARERSILVHDAPLPIAETASTFSELLLYDAIAEGIADSERKAVLSEKIDDFYATIQRQAFFTIFERDAHGAIAGGADTDSLSKKYMENLHNQFGGSVSVSEDFAAEWSCIPHFFHSPFYCYAYSFGNLLALSLYQRYKKEGRDFVPTYIGILAAGGSKKPERLLAEHGFDIGSARFWREGFRYIESQAKELAKL